MSKQLITAIAVLWAQASLAVYSPTHFDLEVAKNRCVRDTNSPLVYFSDFRWSYTLLEMADKYEEIYQSGKRLDFRTQYNKESGEFQMEFPFNSENTRWVTINENFIKSVTRQIEVAIEEGYADYVFFPDMGHSHLYFPNEHWAKHYDKKKINSNNRHLHYEKMFADKEMRPLYHLTEQLKMTDENHQPLTDPILNFKYWNRNFMGKNDGSTDYDIQVVTKEGKYNTVNSVEDHEDWSSGFAVSSSKDGCFPYRDKDGNTRYFDISLKDPDEDPNAPIEEYNPEV